MIYLFRSLVEPVKKKYICEYINIYLHLVIITKSSPNTKHTRSRSLIGKYIGMIKIIRLDINNQLIRSWMDKCIGIFS